MKKTLLVSVFGFAAIAVAGGKIEFANSIENSAGTMNGNEFKFDMKKDLKSEHKLVANIKENNFVLDAELKAKGSLDGDKYKFDDKIEGFGKVGFDNKTIATSVKYDFDKKETYLNGSYKYIYDKLTLKSNLELKFDILKPRDFTIGTDVEYKFDDNLKVKNEFRVFKSFKDVKDKEKRTSIYTHYDTGTTNYFGINSKLSVEYKPTDEIKIDGSVFGSFSKGNRTLVDNSESKPEEVENIKRKIYEMKIEGKTEYAPNAVKGLKTDLKLKYAYSRIYEDFLVINDHETKHEIEIDSNISYKYGIIDNLSLIPAMNINYKGQLSYYQDKHHGTDATASYKTHDLKLTPSAKLSYTIDKLVTGLKLETPVEFSGAYLDKTNYQYGPGGRLPEKVQEFKFNKLGLKITLSLEYKW